MSLSLFSLFLRQAEEPFARLNYSPIVNDDMECRYIYIYIYIYICMYVYNNMLVFAECLASNYAMPELTSNRRAYFQTV